MNKILLSGLAGLAVINAANAVPDRDTLYQLCLQNPDKYVWVEKDEQCIRINPCVSSSANQKEMYCIETGFPMPTTNITTLLKTYVKNVLNTEATNVVPLVGSQSKGNNYVAVHTADRGYYVFEFESGKLSRSSRVGSVCWAYGYNNKYEGSDVLWCEGVPNEYVCQDLRDFARLMYEADLDNDGNPLTIDSVYGEPSDRDEGFCVIDEIRPGKTSDFLFMRE